MFASGNHIEINYRKIQPLDIDGLAKQYKPTEYDTANNYNPFYVSEIQSFNPIYRDFFVLNESNYNRIGLNHKYYLENASIRSSEDHSPPYFVKCSPLLDPIHYLVGKYQTAKNIRALPVLRVTSGSECFAKIDDKQNASYVDGFFSYLSSQLKHKHNMLNAIDFYGSYLAIQKVFKATVTDDLEYLHQSNYFMDNIGKGFNICCETETFDDFTGIGSRANKKRLVLEEELDASDLGIDILELTETEPDAKGTEDTNVQCEYAKSELDSSPSSSSSSSSDEDEEDDGEEEEENENEDEDEDKEDDDDDGEKEEPEKENSSASQEEFLHDGYEEESETETETETESEIDSEESEEEAYAYIENFPANLIFLEKCTNTLDSLFLHHEIDETNGAAYLMQIIMSLIAFQKAFHFTHNDLHTNNIMYIDTDIEFLYYKYNNKFYKVPTYGKIFKIIDFGRAIYRFKDNIYCSDSFAPKGDAHSQYNTEPYFNEKKARVEPNLSFDLCRLGTSIYDFIIHDEDEPRDAFQETIYRWCLDDAGKNIMYRRDGEERYPGFKLYKMIARNAHAHTPENQLKHPLFSQFAVNPLDAAKLDESEVRRYGLNIDLVEKEYV
jgi:hypothetical protein